MEVWTGRDRREASSLEDTSVATVLFFSRVGDVSEIRCWAFGSCVSYGIGMSSRRNLGILVLLATFVAPVSAELVIFTDGGFLKATAFAVEGDKLRLDLPSGGRLVVSMLRVARILEDEVSEPEPRPEVPAAPAFSLRFDASQTQPETPYGDLIYSAGERHALNPALLAAVVRAESAFRSEVISHKGAQGLMQLMPATARRFGLEGAEVFEPEKNIEAGARYLSWLADRFDDNLAHVLAAYNAGEGTVDRYAGVPPYRETRSYLRRIYAELGLDESAWSGSASSGR